MADEELIFEIKGEVKGLGDFKKELGELENIVKRLNAIFGDTT